MGAPEQLKRLTDENTLTATLGICPRGVVQGKQIATTLTPFLHLLADSSFIYLTLGQNTSLFSKRWREFYNQPQARKLLVYLEF